jgi:hypothetical protein
MVGVWACRASRSQGSSLKLHACSGRLYSLCWVVEHLCLCWGCCMVGVRVRVPGVYVIPSQPGTRPPNKLWVVSVVLSCLSLFLSFWCHARPRHARTCCLPCTAWAAAGPLLPHRKPCGLQQWTPWFLLRLVLLLPGAVGPAVDVTPSFVCAPVAACSKAAIQLKAELQLLPSHPACGCPQARAWHIVMPPQSAAAHAQPQLHGSSHRGPAVGAGNGWCRVCGAGCCRLLLLRASCVATQPFGMCHCCCGCVCRLLHAGVCGTIPAVI